ncbi:MAG TPA: heavy metal-responsive transcriptional regulator [Nannocystaceae bacterium]|nr:heavy metal-responsive transcriptional regulator [Nannocystaceae bacterium]
MSRASAMRIGEVARQSGLSVDTVRFYEREGLLGRVRRRPSGTREFGSETVQRLAFIRQAAALGFSLAEIRELLVLRVSSRTTCEEVQRRAQAKLDGVRARIAELEALGASLARVVKSCASVGADCPCPFLEAVRAPSPAADEPRPTSR